MNLSGVIEELCNPCMESKYIKISKYKKMTLTIHKLQEIYTDLWGLHNLFSLLEKTYIVVILDEFI